MDKYVGINLPGGRQYSGYGYYDEDRFVPHGYGRWKYEETRFGKLDKYSVTGNYVHGIMQGPASYIHNNELIAGFMKDGKLNGWGLRMVSGEIVSFGSFKNSTLQENLVEFVYWYYRKMVDSGRLDEDILHYYTSKADGHLTEMLVGYPAKQFNKRNGGLVTGLAAQGFHFLDDGSLWVGTTDSRELTGLLMKFSSNGYISIGDFENQVLVEPIDIQTMIARYFGAFTTPNAEHYAQLFGFDIDTGPDPKATEYSEVRIDTSKNYFDANV